MKLSATCSRKLCCSVVVDQCTGVLFVLVMCMEVVMEPDTTSDCIKAFLDDPQWPDHIENPQLKQIKSRTSSIWTENKDFVLFFFQLTIVMLAIVQGLKASLWQGSLPKGTMSDARVYLHQRPITMITAFSNFSNWFEK